MNELRTEWPFSDPPNVAVFTSKRILDGDEWIYYVSHDKDDGAWQFHAKSGATQENEARVVGLRTMFEIDHTIGLLADLPLGWCAWREGRQSSWQRRERVE